MKISKVQAASRIEGRFILLRVLRGWYAWPIHGVLENHK